MKYTLALLIYLLTLPNNITGQSATEEDTSIEALSMKEIKWDWQSISSGWIFIFRDEMPGFLATIRPKINIIDIFIRQEHTPQFLAAVISHELGHVFDTSYMTWEKRSQWYAIRNIPLNTVWYAESFQSDYYFGQGDFAECFTWTMQGSAAGFSSRLGPPPTQEQQDLIRKWFLEATQSARK